MKIYNFSFVGTCDNDSSYSFSRIPICIPCKKNELKEAFKYLRELFLNTYEDSLKLKLKSYDNYKFGLIIQIIDIKKDKARNKKFYINPLNLKSEQNILYFNKKDLK